VKKSKLLTGIMVFCLLVGFYTSIHAAPSAPINPAPVPVAPPPTFNPSQGINPGGGTQTNTPSSPYQDPNKPPVQTPYTPPPQTPVVQPPGIEMPPVPGQNPNDPNFQQFQGNPPTPAQTPQSTDVKNYSGGKWYASFWFISLLILLIVIAILVIYSLREGKVPSEEKEEVVSTKKKKNKH